MKGKIQDTLTFLKQLSIKKISNGLMILGSYYYSRLSGKPHILGLPISMSVEPITHCNLRCPQCPSGLRTFSRPIGMIDSDKFKHIINQFSKTLSYLTFYFQGEPYLHPEFLNMVKYAEDKRIYTSTSTNAHYLTQQNAELTVKSGLSRIIVSLDGLTQESYEKYRVGGSIEKVITGIKNMVEAKQKLKSNKPYIIVQFLVMKHNETESTQIKKLVNELGADEAKLKTVQIYNFENGSDLLPQVTKHGRYKKGDDGRFHIDSKLYNHCWKMWHSTVITWDGRVVPCCFDKDASHVFGNIFEEQFQDIWLNKKYQHFRKMLFQSRKSIDICQNCTEGTKVWI